jgi:hypothetical protein
MKNEPVLTAAALAGLIMAGLTMAVSLGWLRLDETQMQAIQGFVLPLVGLVLPLAAALWARSKVTPTDNPKTPDGEPGVILPASAVTPEMMAAIAPEKRNGE